MADRIYTVIMFSVYTPLLLMQNQASRLASCIIAVPL